MLFKQDYKNHDLAGFLFAIGLLASSTVHDNSDLLSVSVLVLVFTLLLSPDLDLADRRYGSRCVNRWRIVYLGWFWKPYGEMFKHRSWFTHCPGLASAIKVIYLSAPLLCLCLFTPYVTVDQGLIFTAGHSVINISVHSLGICFVSLVISDLVHLLVDIYATALNTGEMFKFH